MKNAEAKEFMMRRRAWCLQQFGEHLALATQGDGSANAKALRELPSSHPVETIIDLLMDQADPTQQKKFTPWLVREYAAGRLILEDLGTANETLTLFQRYAPRLKPDQRDIQRYGSLAEAWEAVRGFAERDEARSNKAQKALDRSKAYAESRILRQDQGGFTVAVPLTEFAAKWWGKGTRWCTAAENRNQFWQYHKEAPLIVVVIPGHGKFQMWVTDSRLQFMDAADRHIPEHITRTLWRWIEPLLMAALETNVRALDFIPAEYRSNDFCCAAAQKYGWALQWVPKERRTEEVCRAAVKQDGLALQWVPQEHRTAELCLTAVRQTGWALHSVPREQRTYELCLAAVKTYAGAFEWVSEGVRTYDICLAAVGQDGHLLRLLADEEKHTDICLAAVRQNGKALQWVPKKHRTAELCLAAVHQHGEALQQVPKQRRTYAVCLAAVQIYGGALEWVPKECLTYDLYLAAVQQDGRTLKLVPQAHQTYELCLAAVRQSGWALEWVPEEHRTQDICRAAVQQNGFALQYVPECLVAEVCLIAVQQTRAALKFAPPHLHAELLAKLPPQPNPMPAPTITWQPDLLDAWAERLRADHVQMDTSERVQMLEKQQFRASCVNPFERNML